MAHASVSSCVLAIIASFTGGVDVLKKVRVRRRKHSSKHQIPEKISDEELQLVKSLQQGPDEIGRQYRKSMRAVGDHIAVGDVIAQTSLAGILLRINTGLVNIIESFISNHDIDLHPDYRSLTTLSERTYMDTCQALRQLHRRSMHMHSPLASVATTNSTRDIPSTTGKTSNSKHKRKEHKPPQPLAPHGPTVARITIQNSSKPSRIALVKPTARRIKSDSSSSLSKTSSGISSPTLPPPPYSHFGQHEASSSQRHHMSSDSLAVHGKQSPSNRIIPTGPLPSKPKEAAYNVRAPPPVPQAPLVTTPRARPPVDSIHPRAPVPTYYSVASNGTKIGEIPLERWAEKFDFEAMALMNQEAELNGWPRVAEEQKPGKGRMGLFKVFRRKAR